MAIDAGTSPAEHAAAIARAAVCGAGQMGGGIAQVCATAGIEVHLYDVTDEALARGITTIRTSLGRLDKAGKLDEPPEDVLGRITPTTSIDTFADADLLLEAIVEDRDVKRRLVADADRVLPPHALMLSNTSSIPITDLAHATQRADRFAGMHFMNPAPVLPLIEVIRGLETTDHTVATVTALAQRLGKSPVESLDFPGFIANRILIPMLNEAMFALMEGIGTREDIDTVMRLGMRHPMGPLQLADYIGLDTCLSILEVLHQNLGDSKYRPCPLLRQQVQAGRLGRKTGAGFYDYD